MGAVTYPEEMVASAITKHFVGCQVNTQEQRYKKVVEDYRQVWTPDLRLLDPEGFDLYHWNGYLPPAEFVAQLGVAQGHAYLRLHQEQQAAAAFEEVLRRFPTCWVAPEAQYFLAVATYKTSHEGKDLLRGWRRLQTRYPESTWRVRQSFTEQG
jgi:hypothetical protein